MESPSYYAVIPASVRYSDITPNAKLLYGEITCLAQSAGYCYCSNGYLGKLYKAGVRSVSRWLSELEKAGFIEIAPALNQHGQRKIFLTDARTKVASQKWQAKNGDHNNTSEENIIKLEIPPVSPKCDGSDQFLAFWQEYPVKVGKPKALAAWNARKLDVDSVVVMAGLARWKSSKQWRKDGGEYIPHPTTFLNQRRWEDRPEPERSPVPFAPDLNQPIPF